MVDSVVSVVIAAYNAAETIGCCVKSALAEPETGEVIVVDDCSQDPTADTAKQAASGDPRLKVLRQPENAGPAAARNLAIETATLPYIAVLDADDRFLPGRLTRLLSSDDWDLCADNIAFAKGRDIFEEAFDLPNSSSKAAFINLPTFLSANRNTGTGNRSELGFLKPLMRRDFLDRHGLRYSDECRLGEDFLLYSRALLCGARFRIHEACGYAAHERPNSLSGQHSLQDLRHFLSGLDRLAVDYPAVVGRPFEQLRQSLIAKINHREVLEIRQQRGFLQGVFALSTRASATRDIIRDKMRTKTNVDDEAAWRILIPPNSFDRITA